MTGPAGQAPPSSFDIVELVEPHGARESGVRGTVVFVGTTTAMVDFSTTDGIGPGDVADTAEVPLDGIRVVGQAASRNGSRG
jgi:hypothetical protein